MTLRCDSCNEHFDEDELTLVDDYALCAKCLIERSERRTVRVLYAAGLVGIGLAAGAVWLLLAVFL